MASFTRGVRTIYALYGQKASHCAAVSVAICKSSFTQNLAILNNTNFGRYIASIHTDSANLYKLGCQNDAPDEDGYLEIAAIYNHRTIDHRNVIRVTDELSLTFETSITAAQRFEDELHDYIEGDANKPVRAELSRYLETHDNVIVFGHGHFITIVKLGVSEFRLYDGLGRYRMVIYNDINALLSDIEDYIRDGLYNFHSLTRFGLNPLDVIEIREEIAPINHSETPTQPIEIIELPDSDDDVIFVDSIPPAAQVPKSTSSAKINAKLTASKVKPKTPSSVANGT